MCAEEAGGINFVIIYLFHQEEISNSYFPNWRNGHLHLCCFVSRATHPQGRGPCRVVLALFLVWPQLSIELITFIFIVSGDSLTLKLIRKENRMVASAAHAEKNGFYVRNQVIKSYLIIRTPKEQHDAQNL